MKLSTFNGSNAGNGIAFDPSGLKATLADVNAGVVGVKYKWDKLTLFGGYEYAQLSTPSDLGSIFGPGAAKFGDIYDFNNGYLAEVQPNAFVKADIQQVAWVGAKYALLSNLDAAVGYYYEWQNNFTVVNKAGPIGDQGYATTPCGPSVVSVAHGTGSTPTADANHSSCAGHQEAISAMLDWRPVKRVDIYSGVMYSDVTGGFANTSNSKGYAFAHDNNTAFTSGVRVAF